MADVTSGWGRLTWGQAGWDEATVLTQGGVLNPGVKMNGAI